MLDVHIQMMNEVVKIIRNSKVINVPVSDVDPNKTRKVSRDGKETEVPYIDFGPVKIFPYQTVFFLQVG